MKIPQFVPKAHLANAITLSRVLFIPFLIYAGAESRYDFALIFSVQLGLDWVDGIVARYFKITSDLGRKLDTWVDFFVGMVAIAIFIGLMSSEFKTITMTYPCLFAIPIATAGLLHGTAFFYLGRVSTMHLYSAKLTGGMILILMLVTLLDRFYFLLGGLTAAIAVLYHLEGMLIYYLLKEQTDENITSIAQVWGYFNRLPNHS